jgi:hypothetical protein
MTAQTILPANSVVDSGYDVDNSCRFNPADSAFVHKTPDAGDRQKATFSCWIKRSLISSAQTLFWAGSDNSNYQTFPRFLANDKIVVAEINSGSTTWEIFTNRVFRDTSAWYHIVVAMDTTQATAANRVKIYVNGVQETSLNIDGGYPAEDRNTLINTAVPHQIGHDYVAQYYGGYVAEACFIEGSQNAPTDFGEFDDSGIWKPIDVSGLTFGTNGFYLDFEASGNLGNDANGGTDLTESGLAATDQSIDTCTNNFCVMNSLLVPISNAATFSQGNLTVAQNGNWRSYAGTIGLSAGKWYYETYGSGGTSGTLLSGIASEEAINLQDPTASNLNYTIGLNQPAYAYHGSSGGMYYSNTSSNSQGQGGGSWGTAYDSDDIISVYIDLDNNKLYTAKNDAMNDSGTGYDIVAGRTYFPIIVPYNLTMSVNFGIGSFNGTALSSGVADANGYGAFEYDPSRGGSSDFDSAAKDFLAICTKNLAEYG